MTDSDEKASRGQSSVPQHRLLMVGLVLLGLAVCFLILLVFMDPDRQSGASSNESLGRQIVDTDQVSGLDGGDSRDKYYRSLFRNDPSLVQDGFLASVKDNEIDVDAKSDAYFVTHRYIDNSGNIYELYDFFDRNPELAFLNLEAAKIRPEVFGLIQERRAPSSYSDQGIYAYLAYIEVLEQHGYANVAMTSTAANQYAKLAYYKAGIRKEKSDGGLPTYPDYSLDEIASDLERAQFFLKLSAEPVSWLVSGESGIATGGVQPLDVFYAVEQYGSALRYLEAYGATVKTANTAGEVFAFGIKFTRQELPDFYLYLSLSNAATLLLVDAKDGELRNALYPFFNIKSPEAKRSGIVERVIRARLDAPGARFRDLDLYSKKKVTELGRRVPEFKSWLMENGWKDADF
ncbi:MAG: hypothetical protein E6R05_02710 [Candidatus Moraniibacteriota bacterium]|nr:MAG: hypothetical protein E6R05_02710 [Candidatus Moranbacteria bacterium]